MIIISFGFHNIGKNLFYFYLISIIIGGSIYLLDLDENYYFQMMSILILTPSIIFIFIKDINHTKQMNHNKYLVDITIKKKVYHLEGFIDTGNLLTSPFKKESVILVNLKVDTKKIIYVPYKALNTKGVIPCTKPDKVEINHKEFHNCLIGFAKDKLELNGYNCILPNIFKEELC